MGYDEDEEEFGATRDADDDDDEEDDEDDDDDEEIPQAAATQHNLMMMQKQQEQFDEAMRIQMSMKMQMNGQGMMTDDYGQGEKSDLMYMQERQGFRPLRQKQNSGGDFDDQDG